MNAALKELRPSMRAFTPCKDTLKLSIFDSARIPIGHPNYQAEAHLGAGKANCWWTVITESAAALWLRVSKALVAPPVLVSTSRVFSEKGRPLPSPKTRTS